MRPKTLLPMPVLLALLLAVVGCRQTGYAIRPQAPSVVAGKVTAMAGAPASPASEPTNPAEPLNETAAASDSQPDRMLIWKALLIVEVNDVKEAAARATAVTEKAGGYVEQKSDSGEKDDKSAILTIRVPADKFKSAVAGLETLGTVTNRSVTGQDVTEQYVDVEARLKNKIVLRDRLQKLLDRADAVKDILSIETELNRVQGDIDSMTAQLKALKGHVDYATITLSLQRKQVLGPIGFVGKWVAWTIGKLFVIRE